MVVSGGFDWVVVEQACDLFASLHWSRDVFVGPASALAQINS